jgi:hypothetical protein
MKPADSVGLWNNWNIYGPLILVFLINLLFLVKFPFQIRGAGGSLIWTKYNPVTDGY